MSLENNDAPEDVKDYTKHIWIGILVAFVLMVAAIAMQGSRVPASSEVTTKHILIGFNRANPADRARALELVQSIRQRILNGESFDRLAEQYSDDPGSATKGGYIGPQPRGTFAENYEKFAWSAPLNELSDIIQTSFGFHLVIVTDRFISGTDQYEKDLERRALEERAGGATPTGDSGETAETDGGEE